MSQIIPAFDGEHYIAYLPISYYKDHVSFAIVVEGQFVSWRICREVLINDLKLDYKKINQKKITKVLVTGINRTQARKALQVVNDLEQSLGLQKSKLFHMIKHGKDIFLFQGPYTWIRAPFLFSLYLLTIRRAANSKSLSWEEILPNNISTTVKSIAKVGLTSVVGRRSIGNFCGSANRTGIDLFAKALICNSSYWKETRYLEFHKKIPWSKLESFLP